MGSSDASPQWTLPKVRYSPAKAPSSLMAVCAPVIGSCSAQISGSPGQGPKLDKDFAASFESANEAFLKTQGINLDLVGPPSRNEQLRRAANDALIKVDAARMIDEGTAEANRLIDNTLQSLGAGPLALDPCVSDALKTHFKPSNQAETDKAVARITEVLTGVKGNKLGINSSQITYVYQAAGPAMANLIGRCEKDDAGHATWGSGKTYLCEGLFTDHVFSAYPNVTMLAQTMIHERAHALYWSAGDKAYAGISPEAGHFDPAPAYKALSFDDALNNADSYAVFAIAVDACKKTSGAAPAPPGP